MVFNSCSGNQKEITPEPEAYAAIGLDGETFISNPPSPELLAKYQGYKDIYLKDTSDINNLIWYGRFTAYIGKYKEAINIYSEGIERFPDEEKLLRHRGHRYITIRNFGDAINDLSKAAAMIQGKENEIEPDGMPNAQNIPVSTNHGNIYYHLGLAYYLKQDFGNALLAYQNCLETGELPDNKVSATHWLYMILNRLGRPEEAKLVLEPITKEMNVIENQSYHMLCLFYKGEISEEELTKTEVDASANDAILYGLGNYYFYNDKKEKAYEIWKKLKENASWNSFGFIAAESELYYADKMTNE